MNALNVRNLSYTYPRQPRKALDHLDFSVEEGEFLGILGETGAGKTTLLLNLCGVIPFQKKGERTGTVEVAGKAIEDYSSLSNISSTISMVLENPDDQLFNLRVFDEIIWGLENQGLNRDEILNRGEQVMEFFELEHLRDRITYTLSGGEKQRVAIASIYALSPNIILLDEPTSELDPVGTEMVFKAIDQLQEDVTIVMVSHEIEHIVKHADRLALMQDGLIRHIHETENFFDATSGLRLKPPHVTELISRLNQNIGEDLIPVPLTLEAAISYLGPILKNESS